MRAAIQTGVHQIEVRDVPALRPDSETAVVRVRAAGICGSDLHPYHERATAQTRPDGHEVAGEVLSLPPTYAGPIRTGDLVAIDTICLGTACGDCLSCRDGQPFHCSNRRKLANPGGGFTEQIQRLPAGLFPLPAGVTAEQGALVEPLAVGVHAIRYSQMALGARVAVIGAGTIGLMTLLAARALGAGETYVLARYAHQAELALQLGATAVFRGEPDDLVEAVRDRTDRRGADLVVETVGGHADTINLAWDLARRQGTVAVLGIFPGRVSVDLSRPVDRELRATFPVCYGTIEGRHDYDVAIELIATGRAPVERLVTHRFPLDEAPEAFRTAADKSTGAVKVHLRA